jgi:hypothetical protein
MKLRKTTATKPRIITWAFAGFLLRSMNSFAQYTSARIKNGSKTMA